MREHALALSKALLGLGVLPNRVIVLVPAVSIETLRSEMMKDPLLAASDISTLRHKSLVVQGVTFMPQDRAA